MRFGGIFSFASLTVLIFLWVDSMYILLAVARPNNEDGSVERIITFETIARCMVFWMGFIHKSMKGPPSQGKPFVIRAAGSTTCLGATKK